MCNEDYRRTHDCPKERGIKGLIELSLHDRAPGVERTTGRAVSPMDKSILIQYSDMKEEIKDLKRRIQKLEREIDMLGIVSDSVKGTRKDGTIGSIKITGYQYRVTVR